MSVFEIVFSPTGGTQKVSGLVAGALGKNTVTVDLTDSGLDFNAVSMTEDDVAVISVPAYAGRIPAVVADRLGMVIAAVAAIAEHSIARQFAAGRPDAQDAAQLAEFAQQIQQKLLAEDASEPSIPGNRPYKQAGGHRMAPEATEDCVSCGACAAACPVCAIDKGDPKRAAGEACISCMRCIAVCPRGARKVDPNKLSAVSQMLSKVCVVRKECELFI